MKKLCFLVLCILILQSSALLAASGVVSSNKMDITVKFGKNQENITCIQDAREPKQWYYVPNKPRLAEDKNGNPHFYDCFLSEEQKRALTKTAACFRQSGQSFPSG